MHNTETLIDNGENYSDTENDAADPELTKPFDPNRIQIQVKQDSLRNIIDRLKNDEIDMNTEFQRHAELWTNAKMSRSSLIDIIG